MRGSALLLLAAAVTAADGPPTQAEQDEIWRKAMDESRQVRRLPKSGGPPVPPKPVSIAPPAPTAMPTSAGEQESSGCGVGWFIFGGVLVVGVVVNIFKKDPDAPRKVPEAPVAAGGHFRGWWLTTPVRVTPVRTPLGSRVTVLLAQVDIAYDLSGDMVHVRHVMLSQGTDFNVASERTGEAFTAMYISEDALAAAVAAELSNPDCRLRSTLLKAWHERHPDTTA